MNKAKTSQVTAFYPHIINLSYTSSLKSATCGFSSYPQITTLLTTTNFINTKSGE